MTNRAFYAHTSDGGEETWQRLEDHLRAVAERSSEFAASFDAAPWGYAAGLWHDLGKYSDAFQGYLRSVSSPDTHQSDHATKTDHSTAGGQFAVQQSDILGHLLAYVITGHHAGLLDGTSNGPSLQRRLHKVVPPEIEGAPLPTGPTLDDTIPALVRRAFSQSPRDAFSLSFFVRMLFSCLVDADFLDTEAFIRPDRAADRVEWPSDVLSRMESALNDYYVKTFKAPRTAVDRQRTYVRDASLAAAARPPGLFTLTVPTGGGKTLSSLAFALRHAQSHDLRRVVYVIPFTSIIEQNADVFREVLHSVSESIGADLVVEHHCNVDEGQETTSSRLATENWDAPLVVTTAVQFYESLFANRTSRCRKLHHLARSVIILDEAQTLPVDYLQPCLAALRELVTQYGATVVLCTATQPALHRRSRFPIGLDLDPDREIIPDARTLFESLRRVTVKDLGALGDGDLTERLLQEPRVLCIVNTRSHARALFERLGDDPAHVHLSAQMCPEHRSQVLKRVHERLHPDLRPVLPCRVVSTQLIEAGVDIDFPCVYRSLAGLDSIAQAAGRCNRGGDPKVLGRTYVFRSEHEAAERYFRDTANVASQVLGLDLDPLSLEANERYFRIYYGDQSDRWDRKNLMTEFKVHNERELPFDFHFASVASNFRLIESAGKPVIVPWGERGAELCEELRRYPDSPSRALLRKLQRFTVQVPERVFAEHAGRTIELVGDRYPVLISVETNYSEQHGLDLEGNRAALLCV